MNENEQIEAVNIIQEFIRDNIKEELTLNMLAAECGYSPWHTSKIFKKYLKKTIFEYIRDLRLSQAAMVMRDNEVKVIDIAFDFTFSSHEGFTRAFSKKFGISPKSYSKRTPPIELYIPYPVAEKDQFCDTKGERYMNNEKVSNIFTQVVDREARKLIIKRGIKADNYFDYCNEIGCDAWGILVSVKDAIQEPMGLWLPKGMIKEGTSEYVMGVEVAVDYDGEIPQGFEIIDLKPCKMMIFQGEPYDDDNFGEEIEGVWRAIEKYNPEIYGFQWAEEDAPKFQLEPQGYRGYIEGRPVREL